MLVINTCILEVKTYHLHIIIIQMKEHMLLVYFNKKTQKISWNSSIEIIFLYKLAF